MIRPPSINWRFIALASLRAALVIISFGLGMLTIARSRWPQV
jgi:hypothetical protein